MQFFLQQKVIVAAKKAVEDSKKELARVSVCQKSSELLREEAIAKQLSEKRKEKMVKGLSDSYSENCMVSEETDDCISNLIWIISRWSNYNKKKTVSENYKINEIKIGNVILTLESLKKKLGAMKPPIKRKSKPELLTQRYISAKQQFNSASFTSTKETVIQRLWDVHHEWETYNWDNKGKLIKTIKDKDGNDISLDALRKEIEELQKTLNGGSKTKKRRKTKKQKKKKKRKKTKRRRKTKKRKKTNKRKKTKRR